MKLATGIAAVTLAMAAMYSIPANAQSLHSNASQPTARCQGALPVFETQIRKRPLAVQNEGSAPSFITCSFEFDVGESMAGAELVDTYFTNNTGADVALTCTGVTGWQGGANEYVAFTVDLLANGAEQGNPYWLADDFAGGGMASGLISISCQLPPGVGINDTYVYRISDDAA